MTALTNTTHLAAVSDVRFQALDQVLAALSAEGLAEEFYSEVDEAVLREGRRKVCS